MHRKSQGLCGKQQSQEVIKVVAVLRRGQHLATEMWWSSSVALARTSMPRMWTARGRCTTPQMLVTEMW